MSNKILVEFDRKELDEMCATHCQWYKLCNQTNRDIIKCALRYSITFKIKEQIEESDMYKGTYCPQCKKYSICELKKQKNMVCCSLFKEKEQNNGNKGQNTSKL